MTGMQRGLGHKPSPPDSRDLPLSHLLGTVRTPPPVKSPGLRDYLGKLLDQSDSEGCCGWSFVNGVWSRWNYLAALSGQPGPVAQPSAMWAWWVARQQDGNQAVNIGTYVRNVFKQARALGIPEERYWPSVDPTRATTADGVVGVPSFAVQPDQFAFTRAYDQRFPLAYYRVDLEGEDRKTAFQRAISSGYPVQFGTPVSKRFLSLGRHDPQPIPYGEELAGGHSMTALYYDERGVYGPNNWSISWGNSGWFALDWDYIAWSQTSDCWAIDCGLPGKGWGQ